MTDPQPTNRPSPKIVSLPERITPQNTGAEKALLGAILLDPRQYHVAVNIISGADFFLVRHQYIWEAIGNLSLKFEPIDNITLGDEIVARHGEKGYLDIGGPAYLTELITATPTSSHAEVYAQLVSRAAARRRVLNATDKLRADAYDGDLNTEELLTRFSELGDAIAAPVMAQRMEHISDALNHHMDIVEAAIDHPVKGIPTGLTDLNELIDGFHRRRFYIPAARTHHGKTAFLISSALAAAYSGARVGFWNVADGNSDDVISRMVAMETGLSSHRIITGRLSPREWGMYVQSVSELSKRHIYIRSQKGMTPRQLRDEARALQIGSGLDIVFIDYLQRMGVGEMKYHGDYERLSYVSTAMTKIAEQLNVPVVAGAQINRGVQSRSNKRPTPSDIKGSGAFEEDSDCVILIYREAVDNVIDDPERMELIIAKNKITGALGTVMARMNPVTTRLWDLTRRD